MDPLPYYKWLVRDYRSNRKVQRMGYIAKGIYRELLDEAWLEGSLPSDFESLAEICGCPVKVIEKAWPEIAPCFEERDGRLFNPKLESQRTETDANRVKAANAGRLGAFAKLGLANASKRQTDASKCHIAEQSREEKSREEEKATPAACGLPFWILASTWKDFEEMRKKIRKPLTDRAKQNIIAELDRLRIRGHDPEAVLNQSITNSWAGVFELKGANGRNHRSKSDGNIEAGRAAIESILGSASGGAGDGETGNDRQEGLGTVRASPIILRPRGSAGSDPPIGPEAA